MKALARRGRIGRCSWLANFGVIGLGLLSHWGCSGAATAIVPVSAGVAKQTAAACERLFPRGAFELSSVVEASIPFSDDASFIAVVTAPPDQSEFRSVLLSQEGVVLFDAVRRGDQIETKRALASTDVEVMGRQMTGDVRLLLIRPTGPVRQIGVTALGTPICRLGDEHRQIEVTLSRENEAQLMEIVDGVVTRSAWLKQIDTRGRAQEIVLTHPGITGYRLRLISQSLASP